MHRVGCARPWDERRPHRPAHQALQGRKTSAWPGARMAAPRQAGASGVQTGPRSDLDGAARASLGTERSGRGMVGASLTGERQKGSEGCSESESGSNRPVASSPVCNSQGRTRLPPPWSAVTAPLNHGRSASLIFLAASVPTFCQQGKSSRQTPVRSQSRLPGIGAPSGWRTPISGASVPRQRSA